MVIAIRRSIDTYRGSMRIPEHKLNELRKADPEDKEASESKKDSAFNKLTSSSDDEKSMEIDDTVNALPKNEAAIRKSIDTIAE